MVRLQKRFAYKYKGKDYFKYVVTIPAEDVERMGWNSGEELSWSNSQRALVLKEKEEAEIEEDEEE